MKKLSYLLLGLWLTASAVSLSSCSDDDDNYDYDEIMPTAMVTVKPNADNSAFTMQLNDSVVLYPSNMKSSPFGNKEVRAYVNFEREDDMPNQNGRLVEVNWLDSILTKPMAHNYAEKNDSVYGNDPVEIVNNWETVVEDGYLTMRFRTRWGYGMKHLVSLVSAGDENDPYKVVFHHNAFGDLNGPLGDGVVAFRLDSLPSTNGKTVDLTLEWNSFSGKKTAKFKYRTRQEARME